MRTALTIAGSDSGGGAGIQADLKSFAAAGVHGASAITCVTAQNTRSVDSIFPLPVEEVRAQIRAVLRDLDVRAAKTGMLYSGDIVRGVADELDGARFPLVVDPVMVATVGASLERKDFAAALSRHLLPRALLVTPNRHEAERLSGRRVRSLADARSAARAIAKLGPRAVLVKGGHLRGELVDVLLHEGEVTEYRGYRYPAQLHGSGCVLAASIAAYLATGLGLIPAIERARQRVALGFLASYRAGRGVAVINSHASVDRYEVLRAVEAGAEAVQRLVPMDWVPEVGMNLGYALPGAAGPEDVCAIEGRIARVGDRLRVGGPAGFDASRHIARIILTAMRFDPRCRSAINLKYREKNSTRLKKIGFAVGTFARGMQPEGTSTMEWGTEQAIRKLGRVPDVIADRGDVGKEAMVRVLGTEPKDVLRKVRRLVRG
ncbi:MAG: bifunctional hydroxymethylpyrimidine kinase/phosphomethylpyrimidine kinase [Methanobacteriota archaeon]|nr:MAG: bifunctional hydroxymethylpyrimidine kinase/phosphomethylpyrimidine kinase [Euryarchaeota archaeon]